MSTTITKHGVGRKILAILLTAVMAFGLLSTAAPLTAYAADQTANISDYVIPGAVGSPLDSAIVIYIKPVNSLIEEWDNIDSADIPASSWFAGGLPDGVTATAKRGLSSLSFDTIIIFLRGTPKETSSAEINITVPGSILKSRVDIPVTSEFASSSRFAKFDIVNPSATVGSVSINGAPGTLLNTQRATITLKNAVLSYSPSQANAASWFTNLPTGMTAWASGTEGGNTITITFNGTPTQDYSGEFNLTIPYYVVNNIADIPVTANANAKFGIGTPSAAVDDVAVTHVQGAANLWKAATITLENAALSTPLSSVNAAGWFTNLPAGITAEARGTSGSDKITIIFSGTPAVVSSEAFHIKIPGSVLNIKTDIDVPENPNAKFNILAKATITSISPDSGSHMGGTTVTLTGTDLGETTEVHVGGKTVDFKDVTIADNTKITFTTPAYSFGAKSVVVYTANNGTAASTGGFTYIDTDTISVNGTGEYTTASAIADAITAAWSTNDTVTVTGARSTMTETLTLDIPPNKTVVWQASLIGSAQTLVSISGGGTLDVVEGGLLKSSGDGRTISVVGTDTTVKVSGGRVEATHSGASAIRSSYGAKVEVSGGEVKAIHRSIECSGAVSVSGGTVSSSAGSATAIYVWFASTVEISGNAIVTNANGYAIRVNQDATATVSIKGGTLTGQNLVYGSGIMYISGGTVYNPNGNALTLYENANAFILGGTIIAKTGSIPIIRDIAPNNYSNQNHIGKAYYTGDRGGLFDTTSTYPFTPDANLFKLDDVTVGAQNGALTVGTAGSATFAVTTAGITDGTYPVTLGDAPAGVTAGDVAISGNSGTLTVNTTAETPQGTHPLTLTINGAASGSFDLVVAYTVNGTITGSDAPGGLPATLQLKRGGGDVGAAVMAAANGEYTISGVPENIDYTIEVTHAGYTTGTIESFDVESAIVTGKNLVLQKTTVPTLSAVSVIAGQTGAMLNFTSNIAGTYYYLVYAADDGAPDAATVKAQGAAAANGTGSAAASANTVAINGLSASTAYTAYVVVEGAAGNLSAVSEVPFSTAAPDAVLNAADISDAKSDISGTPTKNAATSAVTPPSIDNATGYTTSGAWTSGVTSGSFAASGSAVYTITLTAASGYTFTGTDIGADSFDSAFSTTGAANVTAAVNANTVTIAFTYALADAPFDPDNSVTIGSGQTNLGDDASGAGWTWDAGTKTLTLTGDPAGEIKIASETEEITVHIADNANVSKITKTGNGALRITGETGKTLTAEDTDGPAISADGDIYIDSGTVQANVTGPGNTEPAIKAGGSLTVTGTATVLASNSGTGAGSGAIASGSGDVVISGGASVVAESNGSGAAISAGGNLTISGNAYVTAEGKGENSGGTKSGGNTAVSTTGGVNITSTGAADAMNAAGGVEITDGYNVIEALGDGYAVNADDGNGTISITGGQTEITGAGSGTNPYPPAMSGDNTVVIVNGQTVFGRPAASNNPDNGGDGSGGGGGCDTGFAPFGIAALVPVFLMKKSGKPR